MRNLRLVAAAALAVVSLTACGGNQEAAQPEQSQTRVFKADNGDITIPAKPKKVVATGYAVAALLEADAPLVGISEFKRAVPMYSDAHKKKYQELPKVAGELAKETNYEEIAKLDPDLIVLGVPKPALADIDMKKLTDIAPVVAIGPGVPSAWREVSRKQADAAGALGKFDETKAAYQKKADELKKKYADVLPKVKMGHVGSYGEVAKGNFMNEFNGSWGTSIANDIGANYGEGAKAEGAKGVSEYPSIEQLTEKFKDAAILTYSNGPDGNPNAAVKYVLDNPLWKELPAVKDNKAFGFSFTEASTFQEALKTLDSIDKALAPLLKK
ncbi:ABC transporter substrate-binding protein [Pseudonocardiaceae bacterium YIM PH 21723]|nr:ABC transporter substrate-binding protein [Pseudonocardiaceae bacterium YIM PH 21723]